LHVAVDDEDANVVALRIGGKQKKSGLLRIVCFGTSCDFLPVTKRDFDLPAVPGRLHVVSVMVLGVPLKIFNKEDRFQDVELHVGSSLVG